MATADREGEYWMVLAAREYVILSRDATATGTATGTPTEGAVEAEEKEAAAAAAAGAPSAFEGIWTEDCYNGPMRIHI